MVGLKTSPRQLYFQQRRRRAVRRSGAGPAAVAVLEAGSYPAGVTYDLYFWPAGTAADAESAEAMARRLARERVDGLRADPRVVAFRAAVLRRWPELADRIDP